MKNSIFIKAILPFTILSLLALALGQFYIAISTQKYKNIIKDEVHLLIQSKEEATGALARSFASDQPKIRQIMQNKTYNDFYQSKLLIIPKRYSSFKNIAVHIVDAQGINRYLSWTKKSLGKSCLPSRPELKNLLKNPKFTTTISVGKFDITFKGIAPIYDKKGNFLGLVEIITHFNSIAKQLQKENIYSALVIDKRFNKQLKFPFSPHIIDGYHISNLSLKKEALKYIKEKTIPLLISKNAPDYIYRKKAFFNGCYFLNVPIFNNRQEHIASFLLFVKDTSYLKAISLVMYFLFFIVALLYLFLGYLLSKEKQENRRLIHSLDKTIEKKTQENLELLYTDPLTQTYKKVKFEKDRKIHKDSFITLFNIKNFSKINEAYGFKVGDELLRQLAQKIERTLQKKIYRVHADEFIFFTKQIDEDIDNINTMLLHTLFSLKNNTIQIRISLSFAVNPNEKEALRKLSIAVKVAKRKPYEKYIIYSHKRFNKDFVHYNALLYDAIYVHKKAEIVPYFQGIHNNKTGKIIKYEALARLLCDEKIYSPHNFISIAKDSGFLHEITKIMIEKTFAYLATQPKETTCSINITEDDLQSHTLKDILIEAAQKYNITTNRIILEILEGVTATGAKNNILQLQEIKSVGFQLAIDDFGVEYSNFERLQELDIDFIKIDAKYIKTIHINPKSYQIVKAIASFAKSMDIKVIAEYVENEEIEEKVTELEIEFSQGYLFSKPKSTM